MKILIFSLILLNSNLLFSQIKAKIIDFETKENLPFVNIWVENENIGTTSTHSGEFELDVVNVNKTVVFSSIGYETKRIQADSIHNIVELIPQITELNEVFIHSKTQTKEFVIGRFDKSKINFYFGSGSKPWIVARYFEYREDYSQTLFIKSIKVLTKSDVKDSKFNVRLYSVGEHGEPEHYLYDENIIGIAKKGKHVTEVDLSDLNISFPKKGFFIAIEWLIIEPNKFEFSYTMENSKEKFSGISYEPGIGTVPEDTDENSWLFSQGKWKKVFQNKETSNEKYSGKFNLLAIELTLSN